MAGLNSTRIQNKSDSPSNWLNEHERYGRRIVKSSAVGAGDSSTCAVGAADAGDSTTSPNKFFKHIWVKLNKILANSVKIWVNLGKI